MILVYATKLRSSDSRRIDEYSKSGISATRNDPAINYLPKKDFCAGRIFGK